MTNLLTLPGLEGLTEPWANAPATNRAYIPSVERWRPDVAKLMPENLKSRPDAPLLVDKLLHAADGESGGNPNVAPGDGGIAHGMWQSHYVGANASPEQQIADAWNLVSGRLQQGGTGFEDWGENNSYQGKPFGAFGNYPYALGTPSQQKADPGAAAGARLGDTTQSIRPPDTGSAGILPSADDVSRSVVRNRISADDARAAVSAEENRAYLEQTLGTPGVALPHEEGARYSDGPDPNYDALTQHLSTGQTSGFAPTVAPYVGSDLQRHLSSGTPRPLDVTNPADYATLGEQVQQITAPPQLEGTYDPNVAQERVDSVLGPSDNPLGRVVGAYNRLNVRIPGVTPAIEDYLKPAVASLADTIVGGPGEAFNQVSSRLGGPTVPTVPGLIHGLGLPTYGDVGASVIPSRAADIALTALPLAGEAGDALRGGRAALERAAVEGIPEEVGRGVDSAGVRAVSGQAGGTPIMRGANDLATVEGAAMSPVEMYQKAKAAGFSDEEIAANFGQRAVDAGRGVDTTAQDEALRQAANDAASHAAKRVFNSVVDATGDVDQAAQEARQAAARAQETIAGQQRPNKVVEDTDYTAMRAANARLRSREGQPLDPFEGLTDQPKPQQARPGMFDTPEIIAARAEQAKMPETHLIDTPARDAMREDIANHLYGNGAEQKNKVAEIVLGPPAAGKSSRMVEPLAAKNGALVVDADAAKEMIPEFGNGRFAGAVHKESSDIADNVLSRAMDAGDNVVLPLVGKNADRINAIGQELAAHGYKVNLRQVDLPDVKAAGRAVERFNQSGRFVDPDYVMGIDGHPSATFDKLKGESWVNDYTKVSNDVPRGQEPVTLDQGTNAGRREGRGAAGNAPAQAQANSSLVSLVSPDQTGAAATGAVGSERLAAEADRLDALAKSGQLSSGDAGDQALGKLAQGMRDLGDPASVIRRGLQNRNGNDQSNGLPAAKGSGVPGVPAPSPAPKGATPTETIAHRAARELVDLVNAPISLVTYGHEPVFRQGVGFALSHPSTAAEAVGNLVKVAKDPSAFAAINDALNNGTFTKAAMDAGWLVEGKPPNPTFVRQVLDKIPGMQNSRESARIYLTTLRKAGYESEAARLFAAGERDPEQYKALWDTISDVTGHGLRGQSVSIGGINPVFSPQALLGRFRGLTDVFFPEAGLAGGAPNLVGAGARNVAIKNLLAIGGLSLGVDGIAKAAGLDLKWDLLKTPLGKVSIGPSTIDPTAGYGSIARFGAKVYDAAASGDMGKIRAAASSFINGQLGPVTGTMVSTFTGTDWQGRDFNLLDRTLKNPTKEGSLARDLLVPIAANSIINAVQANGLKGALIAAPSLGAMSVETNMLQAARDKAVQAIPPDDRMFNGKLVNSYEDAGPTIRNKVDATPEVIDAKGSPSPYKTASDAAHAPVKAEVDRQEALFQQGQNTKALRDVYHDEGVANRALAPALANQFADTFAGFDKTKYDKAIDGYNAFYEDPKYKVPAGLPDAGNVDFDAVASAQKDYLASLPADQRQWVTEALQVSEDKKTKTQQRYDTLLDDKKAAGYFDIKPDDPDAAAKRIALDKANPRLDAESWYFGGTNTKSGGQLQTKPAVDQALGIIDKEHLSGRTVHYLGADRDLATPEGRKLWADQGDAIAHLYDDQNLVSKNQALLDYHAKQLYGTTYAKATRQQQARLISEVRTNVLEDNAQLDGLHAYLGFGGDSATKTYTLHSPGGLAVVQSLKVKYGAAPAKAGWKYQPPAR